MQSAYSIIPKFTLTAICNAVKPEYEKRIYTLKNELYWWILLQGFIELVGLCCIPALTK